jgi:hypothetical protein
VSPPQSREAGRVGSTSRNASWPRLIMVVLFSGMVTVAGEANAQSVIDLKPDAMLGEPFSRIRGIRELSDGRVLVVDQIEKGLFLADFAADRRTMLGHNGPGPEEYDAPTGILALAGDTSLMIDLGTNVRLATVVPDGRIISTRPIFASPGMSIPKQADAQGRLYWDLTTDVRLKKREDPSADQSGIVRLGRNGDLDTLAHITIPGGVNPNAFPDWDGWAAARDGRIAIVRNTGGYRLDWVDADGTPHLGDEVKVEEVRVTAADRAVFEKPPSEGGSGTGATGGVRMGRAGGPPPRPPRSALPDRLPPARYSGVRVAPDGRVWVERLQHLTEDRSLLDVFDGAGRRVGQYRLPPGREVVGFGARTLYAIHTDEDGLQWLERYIIQ